MGTSSKDIKSDIENTRSQLASDLDQLAHRVSPVDAVRRGGDQLRGGLSERRERARERGQGAGQALRDGGGQATAALDRTRERASTGTRNNPLAGGAIGFAMGVLAAAVLPGSAPERQAAGRVAERAAPRVDPLTDAAARSARDFGEDARGAMRHAAEELRESAGQAARRTRARAGGSAS
ncbi:DUF3618 domain-containing protein [Streptomyces sp. NBRC 109706]|uniref:DUF3618 domain-containing protein n=1 Tax=Streptomyces sp. NBRC 109706 TaxID=1550035 RepID=UPI0007813F97|nr:DUF3618 domain-containing protein [Streptomyces sp. NBRC 109706]